MAPAHVAVIQGSGTGIGLHITRQYLSRTNLQVVALSRDAKRAKEAILANAASDKSLDPQRLHVLDIDIKNEATIQKAAETVQSRFGERSLRALWNISGILKAEKNLGQVEFQNVLDMFQINSIGHLLAFKHFVPLVPKATRATNDSEASRDADPANGLLPKDLSVLASLSARVGSIEDNGKGGWYSYRSSKASLNQIIRTLSHELNLRNIPALSIALHPGTVRTQLSKDFTGGPGSDKPLDRSKGQFEPLEAAENLIEVVSKLTKEDSGGFRDWKGEKIPW
ncbi:NAD(P)-binding protein [Violaceomyces palustris]|uniref:NAD(P)-binding protein n=1 Tax=Violaceomyces palustris TaxID=1673888 RepID=A0ACD0P5C6_9BASI|nr:NAD(P)-binding protein [Violaceomyces palustris]